MGAFFLNGNDFYENICEKVSSSFLIMVKKKCPTKTIPPKKFDLRNMLFSASESPCSQLSESVKTLALASLHQM